MGGIGSKVSNRQNISLQSRNLSDQGFKHYPGMWRALDQFKTWSERTGCKGCIGPLDDIRFVGDFYPSAYDFGI